MNPTEHDEAIALAEYLKILQAQGKIILYSHIAQETYTKNWGTKMRNKREGVRLGVPDYIIVVYNLVLFIELKRTKGGVISIEQKDWIDNLQGKKTEAKVCKGFYEAKKFIDSAL